MTNSNKIQISTCKYGSCLKGRFSPSRSYWCSPVFPFSRRQVCPPRRVFSIPPTPRRRTSLFRSGLSSHNFTKFHSSLCPIWFLNSVIGLRRYNTSIQISFLFMFPTSFRLVCYRDPSPNGPPGLGDLLSNVVVTRLFSRVLSLIL